MRIYDVFRGQEHHATVCVQDDGKKVWSFGSEWKDFYVDANERKAVEQAIDHDPKTALLSCENLTVKQR